MINTWELRKTVLKSWGFTLMGIFNLVMLCLIVTFLVTRFVGPQALALVLMPGFAFMLCVFLLGEFIVNVMFGAETPHPVKDARFLRAMKNVKQKSRMWIQPRAWIVDIGGKPNAMAYGPGLPGLAAVGVSRELVDMLDDAELEGVLAHEFAHIKCRDTGILAVIGFILGLIDKLRVALTGRRALLMKSPPFVALGWIIYAIGRIAFYVSRFSISQERELAADALGASYIGDPRPLISALKKLHKSLKVDTESDPLDDPIFKDLMVAHPGLEDRIASLEAIMVIEKKEGDASWKTC